MRNRDIVVSWDWVMVIGCLRNAELDRALYLVRGME